MRWGRAVRTRMTARFRLLLLVAFAACSDAVTQSWQSQLITVAPDGRLTYAKDAEGNRIPDFSYAGYRNGTVPIPAVPVVKTIGPVVGDNTASIQAAINEVAALPLDAGGFRGTLLLTAGVYRVSGKLSIKASGVVLRGVGEGTDSTGNTILLATGDSTTQTTVLTVGGGSDTKWSDKVAGTQTNIVTDTVFVGSRTFDVADASTYAVGDNIVIYHPCTDGWLQAVNYGATAGGYMWQMGDIPIYYNRYIVAKSGSTITIDAPVFNTLVRSRSQSYIYKYSRSGIKTNIGIENLRIDIRTTDVTTNANGNEHDHAWDGIRLQQIEDAWVRHCTVLHFGQSGFKTSTATRVTIDSCTALDPISIITGERRYNFNVYQSSQLILFRGCRATHGRHDFVSNGTSGTSGCVFVDCRSESTNAASEGHRWWSQGLLYDNIEFVSPRTSGTVLGLYNRGNYGTGHGWASVHSVAWNCNAGGRSIVLQKPPTAQNYAIGCSGTVSGSKPPAPFSQAEGYIEGANITGLNPRSLYQAQLYARLNSATTVKGADKSMGSQVRIEVYPNPFNPSTNIRVTLAAAGRVTLRVYDLLGREVALLADDIRPAGEFTIPFSPGKDGLPRPSSGMYLALLRTGTMQSVQKLIMIQ